MALQLPAGYQYAALQQPGALDSLQQQQQQQQVYVQGLSGAHFTTSGHLLDGGGLGAGGGGGGGVLGGMQLPSQQVRGGRAPLPGPGPTALRLLARRRASSQALRPAGECAKHAAHHWLP